MIPDRLPLARRIRRLFWRVPIEVEIADELRAHLELLTRRYIAEGMPEDLARGVARARFGDMDRVRDECRDIRNDMEAEMQRAELREELGTDVRFALRTLRRSPLFTLVAILTIGLAIGANTAIFSVLDAVLLRGLPYRYADRTVTIWNSYGSGPDARTADAAPEYFDLRTQLRSFDAVAAITPQSSSLVADAGDPERIMTYVVSPNIFELLGTSPAVGRAFGGDDGAPGAPRVVVLSHALWTRRFGGDPSIVGRGITVGGIQRTVIGIMPPGVRFPDAPISFLHEAADLWIPSTWDANRNDSRGNQILGVIARLAPGQSHRQGQADVDVVSARFRTAYPDRYASAAAKEWKLVTTPLADEMVGAVVRRGLVLLACAVGLVLLIACVNVANLLLARGAARERELAIRVALGAGRSRVMRQLLTESVLLALGGGLVGTALAWVGLRAFVAYGAGDVPRAADAHLGSLVLGFCFALSIITGLIVGVLPALQQSSGNLRAALGATSSGADAGRTHRLRESLVMAQVALALVVLVSAGLLTRSFVELLRVQPGFVADSVMSFQLTTPRVKYDSVAKVVDFYRQVTAEAGALPGVTDASAVYPLPMSGDGWSGSFRVDGEPSGPNDPLPHAEFGAAMPGYFRAMRIPLLAGRDFASTDAGTAPPVAIVDETLARQQWPRESAIGKRIDAGSGALATIIGVVGHVHNAGPAAAGEPQIYVAFLQRPQSTMTIVARSAAAPVRLGASLRAVVHRLDPAMPLAKLQPVSDFIAAALAKQRFETFVLGVFALTALLLATIGLYGVMAYVVSQRTREIGIRMALGGQRSDIRAMILRDGLLIALGGVVGGTALALAVSRMVERLLFNVRATDPLTYAGIAAVLLLVAVAASLGPARRATRVDPVVALRD